MALLLACNRGEAEPAATKEAPTEAKTPSLDMPELGPPVVLVRYEAPGYAPADLEALITQLVEDELRGLEGLASMRSRSAEGEASFELEFADAKALDPRLVRERLEGVQAELPADVGPPVVAMPTVGQERWWVGLTGGSGQDPDALERRLERLEGVRGLEACPDRSPTPEIRVKPERARALDVDLANLRGLLEANLGPGSLPRFEALADFPLRADGSVKLGDIAELRVDPRPDCECGYPTTAYRCWRLEVDPEHFDRSELDRLSAQGGESLRHHRERLRLRIRAPGDWEQTGMQVLGPFFEAGSVPPLAFWFSREPDALELSFPPAAAPQIDATMAHARAALPGLEITLARRVGWRREPLVLLVGGGGAGPEALRDLAPRLERALDAAKLEWLRELEPTRPEIQLQLDRDAMARFGLTAQAAAELLRTATYGSELSVGAVRIRLRLALEGSEAEQLASLQLRTADGQWVPLSAVAQIELRESPPTLERVDGQPALRYEVWVPEGGGDEAKRLAKLREEFELPAGTRWGAVD